MWDLSSLHAYLVTQSRQLWNPIDFSPPGFSIHRILRAKHWRGLPLLPPGNRPDPGIEPVSPVLQANSLTAEPPEEA